MVKGGGGLTAPTRTATRYLAAPPRHSFSRWIEPGNFSATTVMPFSRRRWTTRSSRCRSRSCARRPGRPQANAYCEGLIGTARREWLDWIIPLNERHLRQVLAEWMPHYNAERPHSALGPGLPDAPACGAALTGRRLAAEWRVAAHQRLGGLHHHYGLERTA